MQEGAFFKDLLSVVVSLCCLLPFCCSPRPPSLQPTSVLTLRDRSTRPVPVLYRGSLPLSRLLQGCLWPPQQPQVLADLQKQLSPPTLQPPQNKHSRCQRATGARNEKQVSPRDLSAVAVRQLGVTTSGAGERWEHSRAHPECSAPRAQCWVQQPPRGLSQETVTDMRPLLARGAKALWFWPDPHRGQPSEDNWAWTKAWPLVSTPTVSDWSSSLRGERAQVF